MFSGPQSVLENNSEDLLTWNQTDVLEMTLND